MELFIGVTLVYLTFHFLYYGYGKKKKNQQQMDSIDTLIDDALRGCWTSFDRAKNKNKTK